MIDPNSPLFQALLSMDSYNRSYAQDVITPEGQQLGAVTFFGDSSAIFDGHDQDIGFYAALFRVILVRGCRLRKISQAAVVFLFVVLAAATAYAGLFSISWRYKMTVTVETPEGIKTGSAVREVFSHRAFNLTLGWVDRYKINGEAVVVDLGKRGTLFGLMRGGIYGNDYAKHVFIDLYITGKSNNKIILPFEQWPLFVRFREPKDPTSVERVIETEWDGRYPLRHYFKMKSDHMEEYFGKGVKITQVSIEPTSDPPTATIDRYLPSFGEETGFWDWYRKLPYGDPRRIGPWSYKVREMNDH